MSVINNVLKDLESRSSEFTPIDIASVDAPAKENKSNFAWLIMLFCVFLLVCAYGLYFYQDQLFEADSSLATDTPAAVAADEKLVVEPVLAVDETPVAVPANQVIGLQIKETSDQLRMEFLLREKAVSYLKERSKNSFVYHIKAIQSEISAPIMTGNRWLEELSINPRDDGIDITFKTVAGILVETEQNQIGDEAVWAIKLDKQAIPVAQSKPTVAPVSVQIAGNKITKATNANEQIVKQEAPPETTSTPVENPVAKPVKVEIKASGQSDGESAQLSLATGLMKKAQWQDAEALLLGLLDGPQDMDARKQLLSLYSKPRFVDKYVDFARQSSDRYPQQRLFKTEYARSLFQTESYQMAISLLSDMGQLDARQLTLMAASYQRIDQHDNAILYYQQSLALDRQQARNWIGLGISLEHEEKTAQALKSYQTAAKLGNINARLQTFVEQRSRLLERALN